VRTKKVLLQICIICRMNFSSWKFVIFLSMWAWKPLTPCHIIRRTLNFSCFDYL